MVQWLRVQVFNARAEASIPGQRTRSPVLRCMAKKKKKVCGFLAPEIRRILDMAQQSLLLKYLLF